MYILNMKICNYCGREISNGERIIDNGIKYICKNEEDIKICNQIKINIEKTKKQNDFFQSQKIIEKNGGTLINCCCGETFYTNFPIETLPPCDNCPFCGVSHSK